MTERDSPTNVLAGTGLVMNAQGNVLLVRVAERGWELPGDRSSGEGLLDALRREVEEESGCIVEPERLLSFARVSCPRVGRNPDSGSRSERPFQRRSGA